MHAASRGLVIQVLLPPGSSTPAPCPSTQGQRQPLLAAACVVHVGFAPDVQPNRTLHSGIFARGCCVVGPGAAAGYSALTSSPPWHVLAGTSHACCLPCDIPHGEHLHGLWGCGPGMGYGHVKLRDRFCCCGSRWSKCVLAKWR
jgi:hypothetical protein